MQIKIICIRMEKLVDKLTRLESIYNFFWRGRDHVLGLMIPSI